MNINKKYKNNLFSWMFSDEDVLRELYNAIAGTNYDKDVKIEINTLQDLLFQDRINDISFMIDNKIIVLIEHQSTINENMPLRMLIYIVRLYEKIIEHLGKKKIYGKKLVKIPQPEFYVLYNGTDDFPAEKTLRLSDAFDTLENKDKLPLELIVKVININKGQNKELEQKSALLREYATFIEEVRKNLAEVSQETVQPVEGKTPLEEATRRAVRYCIENNILRDFLTEFGSEVSSMLFTEWNLDDALEVAREEAWEEAWEKGIDRLSELIDQGYSTEEAKNILKSERPAKRRRNIPGNQKPVLA
jgi:hypothetical protein